jgi:hypothetical protein
MDLQHINAKLLLRDADAVDLEPLIPIYHRWIKERVFEEMLLDIADYRHVPEGPGVVLIGLQADYSVDNTCGRLGVRYNRKAPLDGGNQQRLAQAARAALNACVKLEMEESLGGKLVFGGQEIEIFFNDRALAPNNEGSRRTAEKELREFCARLFGGKECEIAFDRDPRRLLGAWVKMKQNVGAAELLKNLGS